MVIAEVNWYSPAINLWKYSLTDTSTDADSNALHKSNVAVTKKNKTVFGQQLIGKYVLTEIFPEYKRHLQYSLIKSVDAQLHSFSHC